MKYISTRTGEVINSSYEAILKGLADDGGLFLPENLPIIKFSEEEIKSLNYKFVAKKVISSIFDDFTKEEIESAVEGAYDTFEDEILPITKLNNNYIMELYHGKTLAFKDFALSILPRLMKISIDKLNLKEKIVILAATSGDTGSAALSGFSNVEGTEVIVFYPTEGISEIQRKQMVCLDAKNSHAVAIKGNFDDAQSALKNIFNDDDLAKSLAEKNIRLSSANSINIGRLVPQIAYYFYSYYELLRNGEIEESESINISVPTGNFGNILAGYLAKQMGLPIDILICASNKNNVLTDFFNSGKYNANREFYKTNSPSMDILVSSNLERLLYLIADKDAEKINNLMKDLKEKNSYIIDNKMQENIKDFKAYYYKDDEILENIKETYEEYNYLLDTHTAIGLMAAKEYNSKNKTLVASTASPFKFPKAVSEAISLEIYDDDFKTLEHLSVKTEIEIPQILKDLEIAEVTQKRVIDSNLIKETILEILGE